MLINVVFHRGWVGKFGGIIDVDFLCFYSSGLMYRTSIEDLYNIGAQAQLQQEFLKPTSLDGTVNIFPYPPYVAHAFSIFSCLPLNEALSLFTVFSVLISLIKISLIHRFLIPDRLKKPLTPIQLGIILFSSLRFILNIFFGQNTSLTLILLTVIVIASLKDFFPFFSLKSSPGIVK